MIAVVDYGVGNLFSLQSSLQMLGADVYVTADETALHEASRIILPGVGAFGDAALKLQKKGLDVVLKREALSGKPFLGICLGMQLLFEKSEEYGEYEGLGLLKGRVVSMEGKLPKELKIPHIGWNALKLSKPNSPLFRYIREGDCVYFVHSFYVTGCNDSLLATAEYGIDLTAAVGKGNLFGCQFHPEKSGKVGLSILRAFCETGETA